ncbi:hypothetical protein K1T03_23100, partial [Klebsiella pneumoniae]|uniref:hypothetical protein n=1 Tax=Klebsiella pneumoniae TaxID=573 RepID=UPI001CE066AB|nr:hypothetical protein [Klebsiella pneumoniae]MCA5301555.1 hypothetical protein [Klebsiella pneumoniae]MCA5306916.1 hypothetical protein [Klebsiella pneumoniae]MCA5312035.1 hypothetical protein [Klebsiella pneumoniae]MCA5317412.1 hypothetical protein [Klebsiella pneumoniae]
MTEISLMRLQRRIFFFLYLAIFCHYTCSMEGANKQVISSQADSLIKISRIWADFFPANTSN